jgi:copper chaperone CopZ
MNMLVAMTYSIPLFVLVLVGLVGGHVAFNLQAPFREQTDACCCTNETPTPFAAATTTTTTTTTIVTTPLQSFTPTSPAGKANEPLLVLHGRNAPVGIELDSADAASLPACRTAMFHVDGMTCVKCVRRVEAAALRVEGSASASVDLAAKTLRVSGSMCATEIADAVGSAGYHAALLNADVAAEC